MIRALDLFAGAGGFTHAALTEGVSVLWAANHNPAAVECHARNHPRVTHACQDLRQANFRACPDVDLILAGPACQGHSEAGRGSDSARAAEKHEIDRSTAWAVIDAAEAKRPRALVIENVPRMARWALFPAWRQALELLGYTVSVMTLNAADYGVPQDRERLFVVGRLDGVTVTPPAPRPWLPFGPQILDTSRGWARVSSKSLDVRERVANGRRNGLGSRFLTQHVTAHPGRSLDRPIGTITCASGHWCLVDGDHMRPLTVRELARGSGFPDSFELPPQQNLGTRLVGNAVPIGLGRAAIRAALAAVDAAVTADNR